MAYTPENNPYIPGDPYSYDLKWIVDKLKEAISLYQPLNDKFDSLYDYVHDYFNNLDLTAEVQAIINQMEANGFFTALVSAIVTDSGTIESTVTDWLADNVNPVGSAVVVDSSLTVQGAAADAKKTGELIKITASGGLDATFFENGTILADGSDSSYNASTRLRTKDFITALQDIHISIKADCEAYIVFRDNNVVYAGGDWFEKFLVIPSGTEFRFMIRYPQDSTAITPANIGDMINYNDDSLVADINSLSSSLFVNGSITSGANSNYNKVSRIRTGAFYYNRHENKIHINPNLELYVAIYDEHLQFVSEEYFIRGVYHIKANTFYRFFYRTTGTELVILPTDYNLLTPCAPDGIIKSVARIGFDVDKYSTPAANTIPSFMLAIENGYKNILADVIFTNDNVPVACHNDDINGKASISGVPVTTTTLISSMTYSQLYNYDFNVGKSPAVTDTKIMRIDDFLAWAKKSASIEKILLEIKNGPLTPAQWSILNNLVITYGVIKHVCWVLDNETDMRAVRDNNIGCDCLIVTEQLINAPLINQLKTGNNKVGLYLFINGINTFTPFLTDINGNDWLAGASEVSTPGAFNSFINDNPVCQFIATRGDTAGNYTTE